MKILWLNFVQHPILGDLSLDFRLSNCEPASVVYLAGENGTGKTAILNAIYRISRLEPAPADSDGGVQKIGMILSPKEQDVLSKVDDPNLSGRDVLGSKIELTIDESREAWGKFSLVAEINGYKKELRNAIFSKPNTQNLFKVLFSNVAINFTPKSIASVSSKALDESAESSKSSENLATEIAQLLIDVQALDDADFTRWGRENVGNEVIHSALDLRIKRFREAFNLIFPAKKYQEIRNYKGVKKVVFSDRGKECFIEDLSSGEKQIVFRGGFFLKDSEALAGALKLIDEPEISLHPDWQLRVMEFYKTIANVGASSSESQIIAATHSPFILHNINDDKSLPVVLKRDEAGEIYSEKNPSFYGWTHEKVVQSAFNIGINLDDRSPLILVEGETDEWYLNKAIDVLNPAIEDAEVKWVGALNDRGDAEFTGDKALNHVLAFVKSNPDLINKTIVLLYDGDTRKPDIRLRGVAALSMQYRPSCASSSGISKGIENLLNLPESIDLESYADENVKDDGYGIKSIIRTLNKKELCKDIIRLPENELNDVFSEFEALFERLKVIIQSIKQSEDR